MERIPHIGIIAGTVEGAALCYRTLCLEAETVLGPGSVHPEVTLHSMPLHFYLEAIDRDDWRRVAALMSHSASKLAQVGADVIVCPNNTLHAAVDFVESPIPWLHIAQPVIEQVIAHRWHRVGILGTQTIMEGSVYGEKLRHFNIGAMTPQKDDRLRIQHIIRKELVAGLFTSQSRAFLQKIIADTAHKGAEAVILACTELPLLMTDYQTAVPLLDSTRLLARAALRYRGQVDGYSGEQHQVRRQAAPRS